MSSLLLAGSLFSAVFFMAQFQQVGLGQRPLDAGLRLLPWTGTVFIVAPLAGAMIARVGERRAGQHRARPAHRRDDLDRAGGRRGHGLPGAVAPMVLSGVGLSLAIPAGQSAVVGAVQAADVGRASGVFTMMRQLGAALGIAIAVAVFAGSGGYGSAHAFSAGFVPAIAAAACPRCRRRDRGPDAPGTGARIRSGRGADRGGRAGQLLKSGCGPCTLSARPFGSSQSSWRPSAVSSSR